MKPKKHTTPDKIDSLLDRIKDELDCLLEIDNPKNREAAAKDLIEYIQLHHLDGH